MTIALGAAWDGSGTTFAAWSGAADRIELCLFDDAGLERRVPLDRAAAGRWHVRADGVGPGQAYGFRVHGPWDPTDSGTLSDPRRLLLDPYARAIAGEPRWDRSLFPASPTRAAPRRSPRDTAPFTPRSIVVDPTFDWDDDRPPATPLTDTVIYELHVKGFTARHPAIPPEVRGTYAGLAHPAAIEHLVRLGVTAVELLPVHHFLTDPALAATGRTNYWGYNTIGYFAPHAGYASAAAGDRGGQVAEFKAMIKALHAAGLEVILDVVYNHTAEGGDLGPVLSFKGLDNSAWYRLDQRDRAHYRDLTACGNTVDARSPEVQALVVDSLRYWAGEMHVDGFRFDLASVLGRGSDAFDPGHPLLRAIESDPLLVDRKLIAEPWDLGPQGYVAGAFPSPWSEWNDRFRDAVRDLWRGALPIPAELGWRLTGSRDRYGTSGRGPTAAINYVTSHDGFTLSDVVAYERKHNMANGEQNRDGDDHNHAWNHGVEGSTDDPEILAARTRTKRNLLATLLLSQGVPMLLAGDEIGRTQGGNNNAYCQDNEVSWLDWATADADLLELTRGLIALRRAHPTVRREHWIGAGSHHWADWFTLDGQPMTRRDWDLGPEVGLVLRLGGEDLATASGEALPVDLLAIIINPDRGPRRIRIPPSPSAPAWRVILDTAADPPFPAWGRALVPGDVESVDGPCLLVLEAVGHGRRERLDLHRGTGDGV